MAEAICRGCGSLMERGTGNRYSRCGPCAYVYRMQYNATGRPEEACQRCGGNLPPKHSKFCSELCRYPPTGATIDCVVCHSTFTRTSSSLGCSLACRLELRRERYRRKNRRRRAFKNASPVGEAYTLAEIIERDGSRCHLCGLKVNAALSGMNPKGPTIDHLVPLSAGGHDCRSNVALAHRRCNVVRGAAGAAQLRLVG